MQTQKSDFAIHFLLEFTKQLIENSKPQRIIEIEQKEEISKPEEIQLLEKIEKHPKRKKTTSKEFKKEINSNPIPIQKILTKPQQTPETKRTIPNLQPSTPESQPKTKREVLTIPKPHLPPKFQDIKPIPTKREIDLGKLNPILEDPMINSIECDGANTPIKIITKTGQKKNTKIVLTKEEINKIIEKFSTITRIPALEGVYKVAVGNLIFLSAISEIIGAKFVIRKIPQQPTRTPVQRLPPKRMPQRQPISQRRQIPMRRV